MTIGEKCYRERAERPDTSWSGIAELLGLWPDLHISQRMRRAYSAARNHSITARLPWPPAEGRA